MRGFTIVTALAVKQCSRTVEHLARNVMNANDYMAGRMQALPTLFQVWQWVKRLTELSEDGRDGCTFTFTLTFDADTSC